jgi:hypothetical protein
MHGGIVGHFSMVESSIIGTHPLNRSNQLVQELVAGSDHAAAAEGEAAAERPSCFYNKNKRELKEISDCSWQISHRHRQACGRARSRI